MDTPVMRRSRVINSGFSTLAPPPAPPPPSFDPATTAWVNAVVGAGGTVSLTQKGFVDTLIKGLKTDPSGNLFALQDRLWLLASENVTQAQIDLITANSSNNWTFNGTGTFAGAFAVNQGYTGNGTDNYLDTGIDLGSFSGNFGTNSSSVYVYDRTSGAVFSAGMGFTQVGVSRLEIVPTNGANAQVNLNSTVSLNWANTQTQGFFLGSRTASNATAIYQNGIQRATGSGTSTAMTGGSGATLVIGANKTSAPAVNLFSSDQIAIAGFGGGMNSTQAVAFQGWVNGYMTSLGTNVY